MTEIPPENFSPLWPDDKRTHPPRTGDERAILTAFLDFQRATFEQRCSGLVAEQLSSASVAPSTMTLHGLARHLAGVERWWFQIHFAGNDVPMLFYTDDDPSQDFESLDGDPEEAFETWRRECAKSRVIVAAASLDYLGAVERNGEPFSLRWLLAHLIAEYARHNGHADLLRERLDGTTGF